MSDILIVDQLPAWEPLVIKQGDDFALTYLLQSYDPVLGEYVTLSTAGYTAKMKVRPDYDQPAVLECTTANGRLTVGLQGTAPYQYNLLLSIAKATTAALTDWGEGIYDLVLVDTFGKEKTILEGTCCLRRRVTY